MITKKEIESLTNLFKGAELKQKGFVLLPSPKGFDVFEVDSDNLKVFLYSINILDNG